LLVTDDEDVAAQAILMSGCYMMYEQHVCRPPLEVFERWKYVTPNFSMRMSNLAAALLRPQIGLLPERAARWRRIYDRLEVELAKAPGVSVPGRHPKEDFVPSSIQFSLALEPDGIVRFLQECQSRGLYVKWFGGPEPTAFTSNYSHWHYFQAELASDQSMSVLRRLMDLRLPINLTQDECDLVGRIVTAAAVVAAREQGKDPGQPFQPPSTSTPERQQK
jgi:dTDP-4-amino-4,6-dideoxygalactose transaminase